MGKRVNLSKIEKPVKDDNNLMGLATLNHNVIVAKEQVRTYTDGM